MPPKKRKRSRSSSKRDASKKAQHHNYFCLHDMHNNLQEGFDGTVDPKATVFFLAIMQYVATEIIEVSGNAAKEEKTRGPFVIKIEDIQRAVSADTELSELLGPIDINTKSKKGE